MCNIVPGCGFSTGACSNCFYLILQVSSNGVISFQSPIRFDQTMPLMGDIIVAPFWDDRVSQQSPVIVNYGVSDLFTEVSYFINDTFQHSFNPEIFFTVTWVLDYVNVLSVSKMDLLLEYNWASISEASELHTNCAKLMEILKLQATKSLETVYACWYIFIICR